MAVLPETEKTRRRRYTRSAPGSMPITANGFELLGFVADFGLISLPQLARLTERSEKSARRLMRGLYDAGLVDVVPVCRAAVAEDVVSPAQVQYGSAPNLYRLTRSGIRAVMSEGLRDMCRTAPETGPLALGLRHFLGANDVRIWLERTARRQESHSLRRWVDGQEAAVNLGKSSALRPDAWFVYRIAKAVLVGFVEYDRGTERGKVRWSQKVEGYQTLFSSGRLRQATGYGNARVLVIAPNANRRGQLTRLLTELAPTGFCSRIWVCSREAVREPGFTRPAWLVPGRPGLQPLLAETLGQDKL